MEPQALVIDGPLKGQMVPTRSIPLVYSALETGTPPPVRSYWTHSWTMFGRVIRVLSVHAQASEIETSDLFEALLSEDAKAAATWLPRWR